MSASSADAAIEILRAAGVRLDPGLSDDEFDRLEDVLGLPLAAEHRAFLATALPLSPAGERSGDRSEWPDWRGSDAERLRSLVGVPAEGVLFDVEFNDLWLPAWGERPADPVAATRQAEEHVLAAPGLLPIYGHRFVPAGPWPSPLPVLSVVQSDVIGYGSGLVDWAAREFGAPAPAPGTAASPGRSGVRFWTELD